MDLLNNISVRQETKTVIPNDKVNFNKKDTNISPFLDDLGKKLKDAPNEILRQISKGELDIQELLTSEIFEALIDTDDQKAKTGIELSLNNLRSTAQRRIAEQTIKSSFPDKQMSLEEDIRKLIGAIDAYNSFLYLKELRINLQMIGQYLEKGEKRIKKVIDFVRSPEVSFLPSGKEQVGVAFSDHVCPIHVATWLSHGTRFSSEPPADILQVSSPLDVHSVSFSTESEKISRNDQQEWKCQVRLNSTLGKEEADKIEIYVNDNVEYINKTEKLYRHNKIFVRIDCKLSILKENEGNTLCPYDLYKQVYHEICKARNFIFTIKKGELMAIAQVVNKHLSLLLEKDSTKQDSSSLQKKVTRKLSLLKFNSSRSVERKAKTLPMSKRESQHNDGQSPRIMEKIIEEKILSFDGLKIEISGSPLSSSFPEELGIPSTSSITASTDEMIVATTSTDQNKEAPQPQVENSLTQSTNGSDNKETTATLPGTSEVTGLLGKEDPYVKVQHEKLSIDAKYVNPSHPKKKKPGSFIFLRPSLPRRSVSEGTGTSTKVTDNTGLKRSLSNSGQETKNTIENKNKHVIRFSENISNQTIELRDRKERLKDIAQKINEICEETTISLTFLEKSSSIWVQDNEDTQKKEELFQVANTRLANSHKSLESIELLFNDLTSFSGKSNEYLIDCKNSFDTLNSLIGKVSSDLQQPDKGIYNRKFVKEHLDSYKKDLIDVQKKIKYLLAQLDQKVTKVKSDGRKKRSPSQESSLSRKEKANSTAVKHPKPWT